MMKDKPKLQWEELRNIAFHRSSQMILTWIGPKLLLHWFLLISQTYCLFIKFHHFPKCGDVILIK